MTSPDQDVIDALHSFHCHNVVASLWADAVANRLEGLAIYLLSDALGRLDLIIGAYQAFLGRVRSHDDVSFALVAGLLAAGTHRRADALAALAGPAA